MSTNKAQGQTLDFVGIYLPDHVFTHGQLYVALSRVQNSKSVAVYVNDKEGYTKKHCLQRSSVRIISLLYQSAGRCTSEYENVTHKK